MKLIDRLSSFVFLSAPTSLIALLFTVSLVKTGIWFIPNIEASRLIAQNPFVNPFHNPETHYLLWNWLGPFIAWLIGASGAKSFYFLHFSFSLAFTGLFYFISFKSLPDREARISVILFTVLPVSGTIYFWVGMDSITLFLMISAFLFPRNLFWAFVVGSLLGMQHFEQALVAFLALSSTLVMQRFLNLSAGPLSLLWCIVIILGILVGKGILIYLFQHYGITIETDRWYWVNKLLPVFLKQFFFHSQYMIYSILGVGWLIMVKYLEQGKATLPFLINFLGLMVFLLLTFDQTRVLAIITFPLIFQFWFQNKELLNSIDDRFLSSILVTWFFVPWAWAFGGMPQWSVLPYDILRIIGTTGAINVPKDLFWPFLSIGEIAK